MRVRVTRRWFALLLTLALVAGLSALAGAATPTEGTVGPSAPTVTWTGPTFTGSVVEALEDCDPAGTPDPNCDRFTLTVAADQAYWATHDGGVTVAIQWPRAADDFDLYAYQNGVQVATSGQSATTQESLTLPEATGVYQLLVVPFAITSSGYTGTATFAATEPVSGGGGAVVAGGLGPFLFHGAPTDQQAKVAGAPTAFFDATPVSPPGVVQTGSPFANDNRPSDPLGISWTGDVSGTFDTRLQLDWWWSTVNPEAVAIGSSVVVTVFADPMGSGAQPLRVIGRATVPLVVGPTPIRNTSIVPIKGTVATRMQIQAVPEFSDSGQGIQVHYDAADTPSGFREAPEGTPNETPAGVDGLPVADAQGLEFSATVATDNQRDESEPIVSIDGNGNIYGCGPSGVSNQYDFSQVSTDGGDQFHAVGEPPIGNQAQAGGGGDCQIASSEVRNAQGNFDYAYAGLGPLTSFAVATSPDNGRTLTSNVSNGATIVGVDRQWGTYVRDDEVLLSYNQQQPRQIVVQKSTNSGLTYGPRVVASNLNPSFPGPMRNLPPAQNPVQTGATTPAVAYFPWNIGNQINLATSFDGGLSWKNCTVANSTGDPTLFVTADADLAGNIYVVYGTGEGFHTYMSVLPAGRIGMCNEPVTEGDMTPPAVNPGFGTPVQVDRGGIRSTVFPWVVAGGAPGRVAVTFYGTETDGDPNQGTFKGSWDVYVNQSLDALSAIPQFSQVKATTHPFHYDSICLEGLLCSVSGGDRSLADFFAMDYNPTNGELVVIYDQGSKAPDEAAGQIVATPASVRQIAGPSLSGATITPTRPVLRTSSTDPRGDAESNYSGLFPRMRQPAAQPATDFTSVEVGPQLDLTTGQPVSDGGFTVTMRLADLTTARLQQAVTGSQAQSLLWVFRFTEGYRASAASAYWSPSGGFTFGFNEYTTGSQTSGCTQCIQYPGNVPIQGRVDQAAGTITLSVPRSQLSALSGPTGSKERPALVPATTGSRMYDATAFSLANTLSAGRSPQGFLYAFDNTPAMDFLLQAAAPSVSVGDVSVSEGDAGTVGVNVPLTLSQAASETVTVTYSVVESGTATAGPPNPDFVAETGTATFPPGSRTAQARARVIGDISPEPDETFTLRLETATAATLGDRFGIVTITNDDLIPVQTPRLSIGDVTADEGTGGTPTGFGFPVRLSRPANETVTVLASTTATGTASPTVDYAPDMRLLTFPPGVQERSFDVSVVADALDEPDETFGVRLTAPTGGMATLGDADGVGTIRDDDAAPAVSISDASTPEGNSSSTGVALSVTLDAASAQTVTVRVATEDRTATAGADYAPASATVTFVPGDTQETVIVDVLGDTTDEPDETFAALLSAPVGARFGDAEGIVTIVDDDAVAPTPTPTPTPTPSPSASATPGMSASPSPRPSATPRTSPSASPSPSSTLSPSPTPDDADDTVTRVAGSGRIATAVELSVRAFGTADTAILARADQFPDALSAATLAAEIEGPVLLTGSDRLDEGVAAELDRLGVTRVYLAGGTVALTPQVEQDLAAIGVTAERLAGDDRFQTAVAIAREVTELGGPVSQVIVARADQFADALSASNLATSGRAPILLVTVDDLPDATEAALSELLVAGQPVFVAGGTAAVSDDVATELRLAGYDVRRRAGATRFDTAIALLDEAVLQGVDPEPAVIASGFAFPDALAAGPVAHALGGALLLVDPAGLELSQPTADYLAANAEEIDTVLIAGGAAAVMSPKVDDQILAAIAD